MVLTACSAGGSGGEAPSSDSSLYGVWDAAAAEIPEFAPLSEMSDAQREALSDGVVTFAEYEEGVHLALDCMRDAGIDVIGGEVDSSGPYPKIDYAYAATAPGLTESQTTEISDGCLATHSFYLETEYQLSDANQEAEDAYFTQVRDEFIACLEHQGATVDPSATNDELRRLAAGLGYSSEGTNCFTETGAE
ncbi:hypothetical protein RN607_00955 [Demequina capsici]|uniref:Uncharacterized protein n=1 Tax=Demequina capsici TaxID=3075620 RepID=A0AA96FCG9_9MICO|nr:MULTISPECIES: hypothetical protein [unclassified Demequina]WNM24694.1 hypothetical protein RN606_00670 [Demequina sp. OYTSA14]WNM27603.1 hypothetical protein RN607_00955 [Demequina sp. PMTSA13]